MSETLAHRGPDECGIHGGVRSVMGCRLLRTLGASESSQPLSNGSKEIWGVIDGAIFNRAQLYESLEQQFPSAINSDADLLIRLYERDGPGFVDDLRGMFALAIWDGRSDKLILARDHLGQKPLFYAENAGRMYFASEVKALTAVLPSIDIDLKSLDQYLSLRFIPADGTMVRGIKKLPPAHVLVHDGKQTSLTRYWKLSFAKKVKMSHDEYIDGLERKFQETVTAHVKSNDQTGAFLSGGLDSSLIVAMMAREAKEPVPTFSIGFAEEDFNEIPYARLVSQTFGTDQHEGRADPDLIKTLPMMINGLDEPSDPVAASFFSASQLAAPHVNVVLGGDGGNELFAGSDRYRGVLLSRYYSLAPALIRRPVANALINLIPASFGYDSFGLQLRWFERLADQKADLGAMLAEAVSFFRFSRDEKRLLLADDVLDQVDIESASYELSARFNESDADKPIERFLYTDFCTRLPEHLLMLVDRMGMTHGLEIRSPMVDKELVEYLATFPLNMKVRGQKARYIERKLAERMLPLSIARRKKRGFRFPLAYWFAVKLAPFLEKAFAESQLIADGLFSKQYVELLLDEHRRRKIDHSQRIWMLLNLEIWYRMTVNGLGLEGAEAWVQRLSAES